MRILLKVLLFPLTLFLTLLVAFCRFFCLFSGMVLSIAAMVLFLLGLVLLFCGETRDFLGLLVLAWLVNPYGLPLAASWLTDQIESIRDWLAF